MKKIGWLLFVGLICLMQTVSYAAKTSTGFHYPLDNFVYSSSGIWLGPGNGNAGPNGHIGVDMLASVDTEVKSVADGTVYSTSSNGWDIDPDSHNNVAVLIKHTLSDGRWFIILYGHLKKESAIKSGTIKAGETVGVLGYYGAEPHLHFGAVEIGKYPISPFGYSSSANHNNFTDPITFIQNHTPNNWISDPPKSKKITCSEFFTRCTNFWSLVDQGKIPLDVAGNCLSAYDLIRLQQFFVIYSGWDWETQQYLQMGLVISYAEDNPRVLGAKISIEDQIAVVDIPGSGETGDANLTIYSFTLGYKSEPDSSCVHKLIITMRWGQIIEIKGKAEIRNKGTADADNCDIDYRVENNRDFDDGDIKLDEDEDVDIDKGTIVTEYMRNVFISISSDGQTMRIAGEHNHRDFPVEDNFAKAYIFVDVEGGGDHDISSETDKTEYGKIEITVLPPVPIANFSANVTFGEAPLTVSFASLSTNYPTDWHWDFGDGFASVEENPTYTFETPGTYAVTLTVFNNGGSDAETKIGYIVVSDPPSGIQVPLNLRIVAPSE